MKDKKKEIFDDHRKINNKLEIYTFSESIGKGFPILLENGFIIKNELQKLIFEKQFQNGYKYVKTPIFVKKIMYEMSGHWKHYQEHLFPIIKTSTNEKLLLRAMTCPHHCLVYKNKIRSFKDMPLKIAEDSILFRYEDDGALLGLERIRTMELADAHIFTTYQQLENEFKKCFLLTLEILKILKIKIHYLSLSLRKKNDKNKYFFDNEYWDSVETKFKVICRKISQNLSPDLKIIEKKGEAAFYGPKLDIQIKTKLGREITLSTIQIDGLLPKKFSLQYYDEKNQKSSPYIIHHSFIGTYERLISILLEQYKGKLPFWLSPWQIQIIPINLKDKKILTYAFFLLKKFQNKFFRCKICENKGNLNKRIFLGKEFFYQLIVGKEELKLRNVSLRINSSSLDCKDKKKILTLNWKKFLNLVLKKRFLRE